MADKRKVEICSAGCPACDEAVALVRSIACPSCDVEVLDMRSRPLRGSRSPAHACPANAGLVI
jgi:hypothetical protein